MTSAEFLMLLEINLHSLTAEERENALAYYREYLEEAGDDAPSAIEALGSPQSVAQKIIAEAGSNMSPYDTDKHTEHFRSAPGYRYTAPNDRSTSDSPYDTDTESSNTSGFRYTPPEYTPPPPEVNSGTDGGRIALTIIIVLVTFPFWLTVLCLWASLIFSMAVMLVSFVFAGLAAPFQGIAFLHDGQVGLGLWQIGGGILCLGLALLLWYPFLKATVGSTKCLFRLTKKSIASLLGKEVKA